MKAGGLESAASYPYTAKTDRCSFNSAKIWGYMIVTRFASEPEMVPILAVPSLLSSHPTALTLACGLRRPAFCPT